MQLTVKDVELAIQGGSPVRQKFLPLEFPGMHYLGEEEVEAATRVLRSRSLFRYYGLDMQKEVEQFEAEFALFVQAKHALAVSSGTGALHIAMSALGLERGQEVIIPAYLWVSVAAAVVNHGAIPVLCDIDRSFCLDPRYLKKKISRSTAGIILVHMSGAPGDAKQVQQIAREYGLWLVEDCAQCAGGTIDEQSVGTFGDIGIFSFQMNKNMSSGEGGCLITDDARLYHRAMAAHDLGFARDQDGRLILDDPDLRVWGRGYRMDELRAAVLRVQLRKLPQILPHMRSSKNRIRRELESYNQVELRSIPNPQGDTGAFLITTYRNKSTAQWVNQALRAEGIVPGPMGLSNIVMSDWGLHLYYNMAALFAASRDGSLRHLRKESGVPQFGKGTCPVADDLFERSIIMAIPSRLTEKDEEDIIKAFHKVIPAIP
jgi:8-amino-3,8-dideoxy-alpha-D-manno-octulosonate transaminase